jgi:ribosomal protein S18 acetylase RimI-like enzyme
MISAVFRKLCSSIFCRESVHISARDVADALNGLGRLEFSQSLEHAVLESPEQIDFYGSEFASSFRDSVADLRQRLAQGCVIFLARIAKQDGSGHQVVGYRLAERGVFSALGLKNKISPNILFIHYIEVLPEFRRQKIAIFLVRVTLEYCAAKGFAKTLTVGSPSNQLSARAFRVHPDGRQPLGDIHKVSLLRGLIVWRTPWKKIKKAIEQLDKPVRGSEFEVAEQVEV